MNRKVMDQFLAHGVKSGASDLHFLVGDKPAYRIDGGLKSVKYEPLTADDTKQICRNLLGAGTDDDTLAEMQEHDCSYSIEGTARLSPSERESHATVEHPQRAFVGI